MSKKRVIKSIIVTFVVIGIGVGALAYFTYQADMQLAYSRIKTGGNRIIDTACGPVEYAKIGNGRPVLVVHGAGGGFDQGLFIARSLVAEGFTIIAPSRFGYLGTPLPANASATAQADMHSCLLDALNIPQVAVLGVSAGAPSSMQFVLRHPKRASALVLLVPAGYAPSDQEKSRTRPPGRDFIVNVVLKSDFVVWLVSKTYRSSLLYLIGIPPAVQNQLTVTQQKHLVETILFPIRPRQPGIINDGTVVPREVRNRYPLEQINIPTLVISSSDDPYNTLASSKYTAENIPGARFMGLERGGHLFIGQEKKVQTEVTAFLKQNTGTERIKDGK